MNRREFLKKGMWIFKKVFLLEINTLPGMTETSLFPMAANAVGLSFEDLIDKIIKLSLEKWA